MNSILVTPKDFTNKKEIKLIVFAIIASAYMTIFYDIFQEFANDPIDWDVVGIKVVGGLISMGIGVGVIYYLTWKR